MLLYAFREKNNRYGVIKVHVFLVEDEYICIDPVKNRMAYAASFPISTGAISGPPFSMPTDSWFGCADGGFDKANLNLYKCKTKMCFFAIIIKVIYLLILLVLRINFCHDVSSTILFLTPHSIYTPPSLTLQPWRYAFSFCSYFFFPKII